MINSVSGVSFGNKVGAMDKLSSEQLQTPGMYASPDANLPQMPAPRKKGGFFRFLGKLIIAAVVVGGALVGARKTILKGSKLPAELVDAKPMEKAKAYIAKAGDWVEQTVKLGLSKFKSKKADVAEDASKAEA